MESMNNQKDSIVESVIGKIRSRSEIGINKYGVTLDRTDFTTTQWIDAAIEEQMDNILYLTRLKKDILLLEEELRVYKTRDMVRERFEELKTLNSSGLKEVHSEESRNPSSENIGMKFVYTLVPKPNETYTDLEKKPRGWHY
jgi:hypothetical protein